MDINVTLIIQMMVFAVFVWFTMKFVWPPLAKALEDRQAKIADGLAAAERGRRELELAQHRISDELKKAKDEAAKIIDKAIKRANLFIDEAKEAAKLESQKQAKIAQEQLQQEINQARETLRHDVATLAMSGARAILKREINEKVNSTLLDDLIEEI